MDDEYGIGTQEQHRCGHCRKLGPWTTKITVPGEGTAYYCPEGTELVREKLRSFTFAARKI